MPRNNARYTFPTSYRVGNALSAMALLLFAATMLLLGVYHWDYSAKVLTFPALSGVLAVACGLWIMVRSSVVSESVLEKEGQRFPQNDNRCTLGKRIMWLAGIFPLIYAFGFLTGLLAFGFAYTTYHRLPWWQRLLTVAVIFLCVYVVFYKLLDVQLPLDAFWLRN